MTTLLLSLLVLTAIGSVVAFLALRHAPEGFEDANGFHALRVATVETSTRHEEMHGDHFAGGLA